MSKVKVSDSVTEWVTRSPIELLWTANKTPNRNTKTKTKREFNIITSGQFCTLTILPPPPPLLQTRIFWLPPTLGKGTQRFSINFFSIAPTPFFSWYSPFIQNNPKLFILRKYSFKWKMDHCQGLGTDPFNIKTNFSNAPTPFSSYTFLDISSRAGLRPRSPPPPQSCSPRPPSAQRSYLKVRSD